MNFHPPADGSWAMTPRPFQPGDTTLLADDPNPWTVKAVSAHFAALTRPNLDGTSLDDPILYTVLDWRNGYRGPCNLSGWGYGSGSYTAAECEEMLAGFEAGDLKISRRNWVRIRFADEAAVR